MKNAKNVNGSDNELDSMMGNRFDFSWNLRNVHWPSTNLICAV